jgi:hypothetical protein
MMARSPLVRTIIPIGSAVSHLSLSLLLDVLLVDLLATAYKLGLDESSSASDEPPPPPCNNHVIRTEKLHASSYRMHQSKEQG